MIMIITIQGVTLTQNRKQAEQVFLFYLQPLHYEDVLRLFGED